MTYQEWILYASSSYNPNAEEVWYAAKADNDKELQNLKMKYELLIVENNRLHRLLAPVNDQMFFDPNEGNGW